MSQFRGMGGMSPWGRDASWRGNPQPYAQQPQRGGQNSVRTQLSAPSAASLVQQFMQLARPNPAMNTGRYRDESRVADDYISNIYKRLNEGGYYQPKDFGPTGAGNIGELIAQYRRQNGSGPGGQGRQLDYGVPDYKSLMSQMGSVQNDYQQPDLMGLARQVLQGYNKPQFQGSSISDLAGMIGGVGTPNAYREQQQPINYGAIPRLNLTDFMSLPRAQYNYGR